MLGALAIAGLVAVVVAIVYFAGRGGGPGAWPQEQRSSFVDACNKNCRSSPGVTPERYPLCDKACACALEEAEKVLSSREMVQIYLAQQSGTLTEAQKATMQKIATTGVACATRTLGEKK